MERPTRREVLNTECPAQLLLSPLTQLQFDVILASNTAIRMPAQGARALFSASRSASSHRSRLPSSAATGFYHLSRPGCQPQPLPLARPCNGSRSLWSPPGRPGDEPKYSAKDSEHSTEKLPGAGKSSGEKANAPESNGSAATATTTATAPTDTSIKTPASETSKESLRGQGYGSARARASRSRAEELPRLEIPAWFKQKYVSVAGKRKHTIIPALEQEDRDSLTGVLETLLERNALKERHVQHFRRLGDQLLDGSDVSRELDTFAEAIGVSTVPFNLYGMYLVLALGHNDMYNSELRGEFRAIHHWWHEEHQQHSWAASSHEGLTEGAKRWLAHVHPTEGPEEWVYAGSPLAKREDEREWAISRELLGTIRSELVAEFSPAQKYKDLNRPVTVLSVLNYKGREVAKSVVEDVAASLRADVVFLDASSISRLIGEHLNQTPYWNRGSISMLGYAAAEINGRLMPRSNESDLEQEITIALSSRLRANIPKKDGFFAASDDRWDELKLTSALEKLVSVVDDNASSSGAQPSDRLIIHIHDFMEISAVSENILNRLRAIVDRLWQQGRKVVIVGSTSSDIKKSAHWQNQLADLAREGYHIIPFHASETNGLKEAREGLENWRENLSNIRTMVKALRPDTSVDYPEEYSAGWPNLSVTDMGLAHKLDRITATPLTKTVYDVQWVYRYASLLLGNQVPGITDDLVTDPVRMEHVLSLMSKDKEWAELYPKAQPPYFSPLAGLRRAPSGLMNPNEDGEWSSSPSSSVSDSRIPKNLDSHEKALLSGLIDAKDIHTSFDDIIVPAATKESLRALTSLSLIRPDAFSYGVLKSERIPGCLLYGPPGNGKTLLAKAIAKESGANMLEISAASINDRWLGQSEKNVRAIFSLARKMAPMVIFLDEADALLGARKSSNQRSAHRETITQFLREWDGLNDMRAFIMVATNRPFDLDEAVLRRLPRRILVDLPLRPEREAILRVMLREESLDSSVDLARLATETELYSGSDLKNLCVASAMEAVREENRLKDAFDGPAEEFVFPERRTLTASHFKKAMREISASISEDMESLKSIRKFDAQYGDAGRKKKKRQTMGFEVVPGEVGSEEASVRQKSDRRQDDDGIEKTLNV